MSRARLIFRPDDFPDPGGDEAACLKAFFDHLRPWFGDGGIPRSAAGFAIGARTPKPALLLPGLSDYITTSVMAVAPLPGTAEPPGARLGLHFED